MQDPHPVSHRQLVRLCEDIKTLDASVHADILVHVGEANVTRNENGVFFDMRALGADALARIRAIVSYAISTQEPLRRHDLVMFQNAQRLASAPVGPGRADEPASSLNLPASEGEEAFCTRMEPGCIAKPAKGVFLKKSS